MNPVHAIRSLHRHRWVLTSVAVGLALALAAPCVLAQCQASSNCFPPPGGCAYPAPGAVFYPGSPGPTGVRGILMRDPTACAPLPPEAGSAIDSFFDIFVELELSTNGGSNWQPTQKSGPSRVRINPPVPQGGGLHFDTEMLQLDLSGGPFPIMIRESPTLPSLGGIQQQSLGGGQYAVDSFFDIFTELSLDGGQSWYPAGQSMHTTTIDLSPTRSRASTWGTVKIIYR